jgi:hypothetical protein
MKGDQILGSVNLAFLHYAGYDDTDIAKLGDLSRLPEQKMQELIGDRAERILAEALKGTATKTFDKDKQEEPGQ